MEAIHSPAARPQGNLSKLYSDAKKTYRIAIPTRHALDPPELTSIHRKFSSQKDRLIAWGLDWTESGAQDECNIDDSLERAGLTEVVTSVLENIQSTLNEADQMTGSPGAGVTDPEKAALAMSRATEWNQQNIDRYADIVNDLNNAIDLLCDLSKHRTQTSSSNFGAKNGGGKAGLAKQESSSAPSAANQKAPQQIIEDALKSYQEALPPAKKIDRNHVTLPEEAPPPYDSSAMTAPVRIVGRLRVQGSATDLRGVSHPEVNIPILVEYVSFDAIYQGRGLPLPLFRLEHLQQILNRPHDDKNPALLNMIGYFEDSSRPRVGLVFELPHHLRFARVGTDASSLKLQPATLLQLLQAASKSNTNATPANAITVPALDHRYRLATDLASSFSHLMNSGFVHRGITSNSVAFFPKLSAGRPTNPSNPNQYFEVRKPILGSFDLFSEYDMDKPVENLQVNIYRHYEDPRITGASSSEDYHPRYDIYSLGLVLLEIGLWFPLSEIFKEKYSLKDFNKRLEKIWARRLASKCGSAYQSAVEECLRAGNERFGSPALLANSMQRVLRKLERCSLIEDPEETIDEELTESQSMLGEVTPSIAPETPLERTMSDSQSDDFGERVDLDFEIAHRPRMSEKPKIYRFPNAKLPAHVRSRDASNHCERLVKIVNRALRASPKETCSVGVEMCGESFSDARPTFCIMCTSTDRVFKSIRKKFEYDTQTYDVVVHHGRIRRSAATAKRSRGARRSGVRRSGTAGEEEVPAKNPYYHQRPLCGASIGAWKDGEHLPPVSFGGVVMVDGLTYGMSVHHLLEEADDDDDEFDDEPEEGEVTRSSARRRSSADSVPELSRSNTREDEMGDDDSDISSTISDSDSEDAESDTDSTFGDSFPIQPNEGADLIITQPALDDVDPGFFPNDDDRDEDHLDSHSFGHVFASSGLKRLNDAEGIRHEIDWALFQLRNERLQPSNLIAGGGAFCPDVQSPPSSALNLLDPICRREYASTTDLYPQTVTPSSALPGLKVHSSGRTSGLLCGRISQSMKFVRMPGRNNFTRSWTVTGGIGVGGDSGAWIVSNDDAGVCGHVLAYSEEGAEAYISPMDVMLQDMCETLEAKNIILPGMRGPDGESAPAFAIAGGSQAQAGTRMTETIMPGVSTQRFDCSVPASSSGPSSGSRTQQLSRSRLERSRSPVFAPRSGYDSFLLTGQHTHLGQEWERRRAALGNTATAGGR